MNKSMISRLLNHVTRNRPMRIIQINGTPYLERYYITTVFGRQIWLHKFLRNDAERHVHDHPWTALSVILTGQYTEEMSTIQPMINSGQLLTRHHRHLSAPAFNWISGHHMHRIISVKPDTWTLMIVGQRHGRGWFFYENTATGISKKQPFAETHDDWWRTADAREKCYSNLFNRTGQ